MRLFRSWWGGRRSTLPPTAGEPSSPAAEEAGVDAPADAVADSLAPVDLTTDLAIAPNDPLLVYLQQSATVADVTILRLESPALTRLRAAGVKLIVPLVSQGELLGLISLGPRRSDQDYSSDDRRLLSDLASRAAPSVRVAQLVRQQQLETQERERIESELRVARIIQETLLPKKLPNLPGYDVSAYWQPARAVGGDFYDFVYFDDGSVAFIVGDVTDKGVPAALVMSTTRTVLRATAERERSPGAVLQRANEILHPDMPPKMFVTCLYALLEPATGRIRYANAGHDLPYVRTREGVVEMRATGMPLGLMPGMRYEEKEHCLDPGDTVLFYSDGLIEAHNPAREMFSFRRLRGLLAEHPGGAAVVPFLLDQLARFAGPGWEQEDDVTIVTLQREAPANIAPAPDAPAGEGITGSITSDEESGAATLPALLARFNIPSAPGNERLAMEQVLALAQPAGLAPMQMDRLGTAVAEATMNAMEHGNLYNPDLPVAIELLLTPTALLVRITDQGGDRPIPEATTPDLEAKLAGLQSPRGWGLFLIREMADAVHTERDGQRHTLELVFWRAAAAPDAAAGAGGDA